MGKGEKASENDSDEDTASNEKIKEEETKPEEDEGETSKPSDEPTPKAEKKVEESENKKKDEDDLRKVIKLDSTEENGDKKIETPEQKETIEDDSELTTKESLEQKRAILQNIKDFDFLIKKNQEDISGLNQKLDSVVKDLDDLVSLYEIVSEQMNPFVGLSKVTKKRIDALENFTKEIEDLKERTGELESFAERSGAKLKNLGDGERAHVKTIDIDAILGDETSDEENKLTEDDEGSGEMSGEEIQQPTTPEEVSTEETQQSVTVSTINNNILGELSDDELDILLDRALGSLSLEGRVDMIINEFIESLKG